jgi:hypothetical protein
VDGRIGDRESSDVAQLARRLDHGHLELGGHERILNQNLVKYLAIAAVDFALTKHPL